MPELNPNRSLDHRLGVWLSFFGFPSPFVLPPVPCLPLCPVVARYDFDKGGCQSARLQNEIALDSNDRLGLKGRQKALYYFIIKPLTRYP